MPEPPASSWPDQLTVKLGRGLGRPAAGRRCWSGAPASIVLRACLAGSIPWLGSCVVDLVGGDRRVGVEGDQGDVADLRCRWAGRPWAGWCS